MRKRPFFVEITKKARWSRNRPQDVLIGPPALQRSGTAPQMVMHVCRNTTSVSSAAESTIWNA